MIEAPDLPVGWKKPTGKDLKELMPKVKVLHIQGMDGQPYWASANLVSIDPVVVRFDNGSTLPVLKLESLAIEGKKDEEGAQRRHG